MTFFIKNGILKKFGPINGSLKKFGPICTFSFIKWHPTSLSFSRPQKSRVRKYYCISRIAQIKGIWETQKFHILIPGAFFITLQSPGSTVVPKMYKESQLPEGWGLMHMYV